MRRDAGVKPADAVLAAACGLAGALACGAVLSWLSRPADASARMAALEERVTSVEQAARGKRAKFDVDAVCQRTTAEEAKLLRTAIDGAASRLGLQVGALEVGAEPPNSGGAGALTPVGLRLAVSGSYEGAIQLLDQLGQGGPEVFVDTIDLTSNTSSVELKLVGRVYCAARS